MNTVDNKYFTKYLPVKEEIVEGTLAIPMKVSPTLPPSTYKGGDLWTNEMGQDVLLHDWENRFGFQPVRLFLCSKNIKVGDICRTTRKPDTEFRFGVDAQIGGLSDDDFTFTVIGEVSPEAVWVKSGMELEGDEQIRARFYCSHPTGQGFMKPHRWYLATEIDQESKTCFVHDDDRYNDGNYYYEFDGLIWKHVIEFKCPTCKTFH